MSLPHSAVAAVLLLLIRAHSAQAQDRGELDQKFAEMEERHQREMQKLRDEYQDFVDDVETQLDLMSESSTSAEPEGLARALNLFNPQLTVFGNFLARVDDRPVKNENGDNLDDRFHLREVEVDFRAAIDSWADGVVIAAFEAEVPGEYEAAIEEGYFILKKLPLLDVAPAGLRIKGGRFRTSFGRFNRIHLHDLPHGNLPPSVQNFLGEEGHVQEGFSASVLVPTPGDDNALGVTAELVNGGGIPVGEDNGGEDLAAVSRVHWFFDLCPGHTVEAGGSVWYGKFDDRGKRASRLVGADVTYHWKPAKAGEYRSFLLGGEVFTASIEQPMGGRATPLGYFVYTQYQFCRSLYGGARFDYFESVELESEQSRQVAAFLTYYTTEFLRFRLGWEHNWSDRRERNQLDTVFLEINFIFGSHPVEPYWVHR